MWPGIIATEHFYLEMTSYNSYLCPSLISAMGKVWDQSHTDETPLGNKMMLSRVFIRPLLGTWMEEILIWEW